MSTPITFFCVCKDLYCTQSKIVDFSIMEERTRHQNCVVHHIEDVRETLRKDHDYQLLSHPASGEIDQAAEELKKYFDAQVEAWALKAASRDKSAGYTKTYQQLMKLNVDELKNDDNSIIGLFKLKFNPELKRSLEESQREIRKEVKSVKEFQKFYASEDSLIEHLIQLGKRKDSEKQITQSIKAVTYFQTSYAHLVAQISDTSQILFLPRLSPGSLPLSHSQINLPKIL